MNAVFPSKVDGSFKWAALVLPSIGLAVLFAAPPGRHPLLWIPLGLVLFGAVLISWTLLTTYYELQGEQLVTRCGPFTWRIPLAEVTEIRESGSVRSAPALSLDRLEIVYGAGRALVISPADKAGFIAAVQRRSARLRSGAAGPKPGP